MGVAIVVAVVLVAGLAEPSRRGTAIGYFGLALAAPGVAIPSIGLSLMENGRTDIAALVAFFSCLSGAVLTWWLPRAAIAKAGVVASLLGAVRRPELAVLVVGFVVVSCSFGAVITYVPIALPRGGLGSAAVFLLVMGGSRAVGRWLAGVLGDHQPVRAVLIGGAVISLAGVIALAVGSGPVAYLVAALFYGTGYGAVQTGAYLAMMARSTSSYSTAISALYNAAIDVGGALGGAFIGLSAAQFGYGGAVWAMPAIVLLGLPFFWWRMRADRMQSNSISTASKTVSMDETIQSSGR
jgi:predicted MFS family arabinose efflux permease